MPSNQSRAALMAAALLLCTYAPGARAAKAVNTAVVDGFTVNLLKFPKVAKLHNPTSSAGNVTIGSNADGTNPYTNTTLDGSPFLSMDAGGSVAFTFNRPSLSYSMIWGTPDSYNYLNLYDVNGALIGTLNGGDIGNAFGFTNGQLVQIVSPVAIGSITASSDQCCFEIGNNHEGRFVHVKKQ